MKAGAILPERVCLADGTAQRFNVAIANTSRGETHGSLRSNSRISAKRLRLELLARLSVPRQMLKPSVRNFRNSNGAWPKKVWLRGQWTMWNLFARAQQIEIAVSVSSFRWATIQRSSSA